MSSPATEDPARDRSCVVSSTSPRSRRTTAGRPLRRLAPRPSCRPRPRPVRPGPAARRGHYTSCVPRRGCVGARAHRLPPRAAGVGAGRPPPSGRPRAARCRALPALHAAARHERRPVGRHAARRHVLQPRRTPPGREARRSSGPGPGPRCGGPRAASRRPGRRGTRSCGHRGRAGPDRRSPTTASTTSCSSRPTTAERASRAWRLGLGDRATSRSSARSSPARTCPTWCAAFAAAGAGERPPPWSSPAAPAGTTRSTRRSPRCRRGLTSAAPGSCRDDAVPAATSAAPTSSPTRRTARASACRCSRRWPAALRC